jgi:hypothetical protein
MFVIECYAEQPRNNLHDAIWLDHSWFANTLRERFDNGFVVADSANG